MSASRSLPTFECKVQCRDFLSLPITVAFQTEEKFVKFILPQYKHGKIMILILRKNRHSDNNILSVLLTLWKLH